MDPALFKNSESCSGAPFAGGGCTGNPCPGDVPILRCCMETYCDPQDDAWVEYECTGTPCDGLIANRTNPDDGLCYCHGYFQFTLNGNSNWPEGSPTGCNYPLTLRYVCSGCRVIDGVCATPADWRPDSSLPCGYIDGGGTPFYEAASPAPGWEWSCAPTCPGDEDFGPCLACIGSNDCHCNTLAGPDWANPCGCENDLCGAGTSGACFSTCSYEIDPNGWPIADALCPVTAPLIACPSTRVEYLRDCEGLHVCCYRYRVVDQAGGCCVASDWQCIFLGITTITLERVGTSSCVWDDDPSYRCRTRLGGDPATTPPDHSCPVTPGTSTDPYTQCTP